jgi:PBP1b-binding outer membrane lipoprotein LpoB
MRIIIVLLLSVFVVAGCGRKDEPEVPQQKPQEPLIKPVTTEELDKLGEVYDNRSNSGTASLKSKIRNINTAYITNENGKRSKNGYSSF